MPMASKTVQPSPECPEPVDWDAVLGRRRITLQDARAALGRDGERLTDMQVARLMNVMYDAAHGMVRWHRQIRSLESGKIIPMERQSA